MTHRPRKILTIAQYFADPSSLRNPDDLRIYRFLVEAGFLTAPEQLELDQRSCFKETPLATWMRQKRRSAE